MSQFLRLADANGSWPRLKKEWTTQCQILGEEFDYFAQETFSVLDPLAKENHPKAGVFGYEQEDGFGAICQVNCAPIPGYDSPVLRVRLITLSPDYDFGDKTLEQYSAVLLGIFTGAFALSFDGMPCRYLKFHLQSPADRQFFAALEGSLGQLGVFESVQTRGSWLYVTKK